MKYLFFSGYGTFSDESFIILISTAVSSDGHILILVRIGCMEIWYDIYAHRNEELLHPIAILEQSIDNSTYTRTYRVRIQIYNTILVCKLKMFLASFFNNSVSVCHLLFLSLFHFSSHKNSQSMHNSRSPTLLAWLFVSNTHTYLSSIKWI